MMQTFLPPAPTTSDLTQAYNILSLMASPQAYQDRLDNLVVKTNDSNEALAKALSTKQEADNTYNQALAALTDANNLQQALKHQQDTLLSQQADLLSRSQDLDNKSQIFQDSLAQSKAALAAREADVSNREKVMADKEATIQNRMDEAAKLEADAASLKADYEDRLAKLKALAG